jgi:hypothetical protein
MGFFLGSKAARVWY